MNIQWSKRKPEKEGFYLVDYQEIFTSLKLVEVYEILDFTNYQCLRCSIDNQNYFLAPSSFEGAKWYGPIPKE